MLHSSRSVRALLGGILTLALLLGTAPTSAAAAGERWCPSQTQFCSENAFYDFWRANGGLEILGYPIDAPRRFPDGLIRQVYERAVMEWHPEEGVDHQVLLARLAAEHVEAVTTAQRPPPLCAHPCDFFPETNHTLRGTFREYWLAYGGWRSSASR